MRPDPVTDDTPATPSPHAANAISVQPEQFEPLLERSGVRIERIVSRGQVTPPDQPYIQGWDEWVMVLAGEAKLELDDRGGLALAAGEHLLIPAGVAHRVTYTADSTIWLAVHLGADR